MSQSNKKIWALVKKNVQDVDPEDLMDVAPDDEYDDYVSAIVSKINNGNLLLESIQDIFPSIPLEKRDALYDKLIKINIKD